jgi:hypothetical protein
VSVKAVMIAANAADLSFAKPVLHLCNLLN